MAFRHQDEPALRATLRPCFWNQAQIIEASHLVVFLARRTFDVGDLDRLIATWASNQVSIALGNVMTAAAMLGVDTCPIEGLSPPDDDGELGLEDSPYRSCVVCAAGYRSSDDKYATLAKMRYLRADLIEHR